VRKQELRRAGGRMPAWSAASGAATESGHSGHPAPVSAPLDFLRGL